MAGAIDQRKVENTVLNEGSDGNLILFEYLTSNKGRKDPYPIYQKLRESGKIRYLKDTTISHPTPGFHLLTGLKESQAILNNDNFTNLNKLTHWQIQANEKKDYNEQFHPVLKLQKNWDSLFNQDTPSKLSKAIVQSLKSNRIKTIENEFNDYNQKLVDSFEDNEIDFIGNLAHPSIMYILSNMFGIPAEDQQRIKLWIDHLVSSIDIGKISQKELNKLDMKTLELKNYLGKIFNYHLIKSTGTPDLISTFSRLMTNEENISRNQLIDNLIFLLLTCYEISLNLLGNGMYALIQNPRQLKILQNDRTLITNCIEEMLRYDPPLQEITGKMSKNINIYGNQIQKGEFILILIGAANRDSSKIPIPDKFDITRNPIKHLTFNENSSYHLIINVSKKITGIILNCILDKLEQIELVGTPIYKDSFRFRGLAELPMSNTFK